MRFISTPQLHRRHGHRSYVDIAAIKHVRDRGLDHAVEREKHLRPVLEIKDLIKAEPSKSLHISSITRSRDSLGVPTRPMDFIRRYPTVFEEFLPGGDCVHPHIRLTAQVLDLDSDENLVYQSESYKRDVADRLVKLLMISRVNKIPLRVLDSAKWDIGLPHDYAKSIVPEFPDYFRVIAERGSSPALELVCWNDQLAVSAVEKVVNKELGGCHKPTTITFPMQFSKGFEMDKKFKKWLDDWQKLPYVSAYANAVHLGPNSDESDKWVVGILHEVLNLFVSKKAERDTLLGLGEWLGVRARIKRALLHHPGVFYLSSKTGTCTVLLKEAYKRGLLIEKNQLMDIRNRYVHLMNKVSRDSKQQDMKKASESNGQVGNENGDDRTESDCDIGEVQDDCSDVDIECSTIDEDQEEVKNVVPTRRKIESGWAVNADGRAEGRNFDGDRRAKGRNFDDDKRARSRNFDADRRVRGRSFDADRRTTGRNFDDDGRAGSRNFVADRRATGRNFDDDGRAERRNFDADRRGRGRNIDVGGPSRSSERKIVSEKNHGKISDKGEQRISGHRKMQTRDRNMLGRSASDGGKRKLLTKKSTNSYQKASSPPSL